MQKDSAVNKSAQKHLEESSVKPTGVEVDDEDENLLKIKVT